MVSDLRHRLIKQAEACEWPYMTVNGRAVREEAGWRELAEQGSADDVSEAMEKLFDYAEEFPLGWEDYITCE